MRRKRLRRVDFEAVSGVDVVGDGCVGDVWDGVETFFLEVIYWYKL